MNLRFVLVVGATVLSGVVAQAHTSPSGAIVAFDSPCSDSAGATAGDGGFSRGSAIHCGSEDGSNADSSGPTVHVKWVDCGPARLMGHTVGGRQTAASYACKQVFNDCALNAIGRQPVDPFVTTKAELQQSPGHVWTMIGENCNARTSRPQLTPLLVRQQVEKLVPHPGIGVAPPGGRTLVNLQTVLWADTPADRRLGTVRLLGIYRVALRVHVQQVLWDFGDGTSARTGSPGRPYRAGEHCATVTCPGHFGHVFGRTGSMTITSQVSWTGQYSVNGGQWQTIAGAVTGPQAAAEVTVVQARGVLVADPSPH